MTAFHEIQTAIEYIEDNISEPLDINALAEKANLSPYYFQRLFSRLVGRPVADYRRQRRLARSLNPLRSGGGRVLDVALNLGFSNHETFTRAFKASFGVTPEDYRSGKRISSEFDIVLVPDVSLKYKLVDEDVPLISDGIMLEISRREYTRERIYAGLLTTETNPGSAWCVYNYMKPSNVPFLCLHGDHAGINMGKGSDYRYLAGYQVTGRDPNFVNARGWPDAPGVPEYLTNDYVSLPSGEYLVCTFTAEDFNRLVVEAIYRVIRYFFGTFIKNHGLEVRGPVIEIYD